MNLLNLAGIYLRGGQGSDRTEWPGAGGDIVGMNLRERRIYESLLPGQPTIPILIKVCWTGEGLGRISSRGWPVATRAKVRIVRRDFFQL